jgi:hypothetical protein
MYPLVILTEAVQFQGEAQPVIRVVQINKPHIAVLQLHTEKNPKIPAGLFN